MAVLQWDQTGKRTYETGVDHGVLYIPDSGGAYSNGVAWNGLTTVTESPSGAEATPQYADNIKYLNLISAEEFGATIEAFTYPDEFAQFDGLVIPSPGVTVGQQSRKSFGLSYRSKVGNDVDGSSHGYKLHLIYGCNAAPSEKAYNTVNDTPEAITFSWELTTSAVDVPGYSPTALITIDSTKVGAPALATLEQALYGAVGVDPMLPLPEALLAMFTGTSTVATPTKPGFASNVITIPTVTGVDYFIRGALQSPGALPAITEDTVVTARPKMGYTFPAVIDDDWLFEKV